MFSSKKTGSLKDHNCQSILIILLLIINYIFITIETPITTHLFAHDFNILIKSQNIMSVQPYLQNLLELVGNEITD